MHAPPEILHNSPASPLRLLEAGVHSAPEGKDFPPHAHICWEFVYYRSGNIRCTIGNEEYVTEPGMLLITPPRTVHFETALTAYENTFLAMEAPPGTRWPRVFLDDEEKEIGGVFARLLRETRESRAQRSEMVGLLLLQLELLLRRQAGERKLPAGEQAVRRAEHFIENHLASRPGLPEIARAAGVAPSTLRENFARYRGHSPWEYLRRIRVRYALSLLRSSTLTLETIAELSGYDSASHLSRQVKKATSMSPGAVRSQSRAATAEMPGMRAGCFTQPECSEPLR